MSSVFVAVHKLHSKDSAELVRKALSLLGDHGGSVHLAHVFFEPVATDRRNAEVKAALEKLGKPFVGETPAVDLHYHALPVVRPCSSYSEPALDRAQALCAAAASLRCSVMVMGGSSRKVRDTAAPAFLVGHSVEFWVLQASRLPVYFTAEGRRVVPVQLQAGQSSLGQIGSIPAPPLVPAMA